MEETTFRKVVLSINHKKLVFLARMDADLGVE